MHPQSILLLNKFVGEDGLQPKYDFTKQFFAKRGGEDGDFEKMAPRIEPAINGTLVALTNTATAIVRGQNKPVTIENITFAVRGIANGTYSDETSTEYGLIANAGTGIAAAFNTTMGQPNWNEVDASAGFAFMKQAAKVGIKVIDGLPTRSR
jgi:hypothetical protein